MKASAFVFAAVLALPAVAQDKAKVPAAEAEVLFLRAFYLDKGERRFDEAIELYRKFLDAAPEHRYAAPAARNAFGLLNRVGKVEEANKLREAHAKLLDRVPVADREPAEAEATPQPRGRAGADAAAQPDARREQMAQRLTELKERLEAAKTEGDEQQVERLTAQVKRLEDAIASGATGRGPGAGRGAGAGGGRGGFGQQQKPLTEMSQEELTGFQERMKPMVERMVERLRQNGDDAGADKLNASYEKAIGLIKEGKLEEAEKIRAELMPRRRRGG